MGREYYYYTQLDKKDLRVDEGGNMIEGGTMVKDVPNAQILKLNNF
jgi:hypothetical protein